jgi:hypothetical protein
MNDKHKIELNIPPYTRNDVIIGEQVPSVGFMPFSVAYGTPPSGNPLPIRVDEDGYVMARPTDEVFALRVIELRCHRLVEKWRGTILENCATQLLAVLEGDEPGLGRDDLSDDLEPPSGFALRYSIDPRTGAKCTDRVTQEFARSETVDNISFQGLPLDASIDKYWAHGPLPPDQWRKP